MNPVNPVNPRNAAVAGTATRALVGVALLVSLAACGSSGSSGTSSTSGSDASAPTTTASAQGASTSPGAEDEFLRLTATHLCTVQGTVYDDPADLAAAYEGAPAYPSLSDEQVAAFDKRVTSDPAFSARLLEQVATACGQP
ncbi:hypothetical protein GCM10022415_15630 [Knoellia locipacati]|uniref:Uncharacterized protein n=1 Tax=Knoellia locipacati TaxID=882824 RepID=A0A512T017_9MICO|nr:hypothetical protein [Knoellia locipacati]GEQ13513.1 hypothetical protein KLO01_15600 [Knoellia locipacati]